jgi:hypothetical protein
MFNKKDHPHQNPSTRSHRKPKLLRSGYAPGANPDTVQHPLRASLILIARIASTSQTQHGGAQSKAVNSTSKVPQLEYASANPYWVLELGQHLDVIVGLCQNGSRALDHLLALASAELEGGEISGETVEGLGWLLSELGDIGAWATVMAQSCKASTTDFCPPDRHV